jgi:hypothetical protein
MFVKIKFPEQGGGGGGGGGKSGVFLAALKIALKRILSSWATNLLCV